MKPLLTLPLASFCLGLTACDFNSPLPGNDVYNPLNAPGSGQELGVVDPNANAVTAGTFLQTLSPNVAFFSSFPQGTDQPVKMLSQGTDVKVISTKGSYAKVEVMSTASAGEVGYVPTVMLGEKRSPNEIQVTGGGVSPDVPADTSIPEIQPPELGDPSQPSE